MGISVGVIRQMALTDVASVVVMEEIIFPEPWSEGVFVSELSQPGRLYLVSENDGVITGYAGMMTVLDDAHITTMAVSPEVRGGKVATRFLLDLIDHGIKEGAKHLTLEVRVSNEPAQALYRKFGMAPVGVRKNYYLNEDALIMWASDIDQNDYRIRLDRIREEL